MPLKGIPEVDKYIFYFERYLWHDRFTQILVDGIPASTEPGHPFADLLGYRLYQSGNIILNFTGKIRPVLSIDRNTIVEYPGELIDICKRLVETLVLKIADTLIAYLDCEGLDGNSDEANLALDLVLTNYIDFSGELLDLISKSKFGTSQIVGLKNHISLATETINEILSSHELTLNNIDFRTFNSIARELIYGKMIAANDIKVCDLETTILSDQFIAPSALFKDYRGSLHYNYMVKADSWLGDYNAYDIVSNIWPLVPDRVFDKFTLEKEDRFFSPNINRVKALREVGNGIAGIAALEPAMINPKFGISSHQKDDFGQEKSLIGRCENIQHSYWLFELNDHGRLRRNEQKDYALFVFTAPKELSDEDKTRLNDFIGKDDVYVKGVQEGWSILFLGYDRTYYILPGICKKMT